MMASTVDNTMKNETELPPRKRLRLNSISADNTLGLTCFISDNIPSVTGVIKSRLEDFIVCEVDKNNDIISFKDYNVPERVEHNTAVDEVPLLSEEIKISLKKVVDGELAHFDINAPEDKEERTYLHKGIKSYDKNLSSSTISEGNKRLVRVVLGNKNNSRYDKINPNEKFLHFTMMKWNLGTNDAILRLSTILKIHPKRFGYAGLKDKRGVTLQRVSCHMMDAGRLAGITKKFMDKVSGNSNRVLQDGNFILGDFEYRPEGLFLGDNNGNRFSVVIRNCNVVQEENCNIIHKSLSEKGFINYFGKQRFGNNYNTHTVGKYIISKNYKNAIDEILMPNQESQKLDVFTALKHFKDTKNAAESLALLKFKTGIEGLVLSSLARDPNNYKSAIKKLPRKQQTLYCHAFQSYLWNMIVSERISKLGCVVLPGDLIQKARDTPVTIVVDPCTGTSAGEVVLPLPGYDVNYPDNEMKQIYDDVLSRNGVTSETFTSAICKEFNMSGSYRNIIVIPKDVTLTLLPYSDPSDKLIETDLDRVMGVQFLPKSDGQLRALRLEFTLPKSAYATMLIREISKGSIG